MRNLPIAFEMPGKPQAFIAVWATQDWTRRRNYMSWTKAVRDVAALHGAVELFASKDHPLHVHTRAWFADGRHGDPENIHKAVVDALFYREKKAGPMDKYTGGAYSPPKYDADRPRVEIVIADGNLPLKETIPEGW
jgi:hypothetical protein